MISADIKYDESSMILTIGNEKISLQSFIAKCAESFSNPEPVTLKNKELIRIRDLFVEGGIKALFNPGYPEHWIQFGITLGENKYIKTLFQQLYELVFEFINKDSIDNFFYMYKLPGLRIRFQIKPVNKLEIMDAISTHLKKWVSKKYIVDFVPGIYEPESHLFGGELSMPYVHKLFTADSLAFLKYRTLVLNRKITDQEWLLSLTLLKHFFSQLGISGWEDIDVWDRVRKKTFRSVPDEMIRLPDFQTAASEIKSHWEQIDLVTSTFSQATKKIVEEYTSYMEPVIVTWKKNYFETTNAYIGIREAAAFFTIFHWNRAGISFARQCIITEALAMR